MMLSILDITTHVLNINIGKNRSIMEQCQKLREYAAFIDEIRKQQSSGLNITEAVDAAVRICIKQGILKDLLSSHRAEVLDMILTEYDEEKYRAMERKEWIEEGEKHGKALSVLELLEDYGPIPDDIRQRILNEHNEQILRSWLRLAAHAGSLEKFLNELNN